MDHAVAILVAEGLITRDAAGRIAVPTAPGAAREPRTAEPGETAAPPGQAGAPLRVEPPGAAGPDRPPSPLVELAGYVGGGFVLAGGGLALGYEWSALSAGTRAGLLGVLTVLLAAVAVLAGRPWLPAAATGAARRRMASTLAALGAAGVWLTASQLSPNGEGLGVAVPASIAALLGYLVLGGTAALVACWVASVALLYSVLDASHAGPAWGVAGLATVGAGWLTLVALRRLPAGEAKAAAVLGGLSGLFAAENGALSGGGVTWLGAAVGGLFLLGGFAFYRMAGQPVVLVPVALTALLVPSTVVATEWHNVAAGGAVLVLVGVAVLAAGAAGLRHRTAPQPAVTEPVNTLMR